jgi:hypothetical protein
MDNSNGNRKKGADPLMETTTKTLRPGDYPVGSIESCAAARSLLKNKPKTVIRVVFVGGSEYREPLPPTKNVPGSDVVIEYSYEDTDGKNRNGRS